MALGDPQRNNVPVSLNFTGGQRCQVQNNDVSAREIQSVMSEEAVGRRSTGVGDT